MLYKPLTRFAMALVSVTSELEDQTLSQCIPFARELCCVDLVSVHDDEPQLTWAMFEANMLLSPISVQLSLDDYFLMRQCRLVCARSQPSDS